MKKMASKKQITKLREELVDRAANILDENGQPVFNIDWLKKYILDHPKKINK